jgi:maltose alpha-D-glucosyltransferase/alpha-amylase
MVTNERDYMYLAYSADPRMGINLGFRRRLAPLVENNRRRIEVLNSLLLSFPGRPILYYGDEIGMGTTFISVIVTEFGTHAMEREIATPGLPPGRGPGCIPPSSWTRYGDMKQSIVEAQQGDPSSLLSWMRNMIALRKLFRVLGRGSIEFLDPSNRKVLAYLRQYEGEQVLGVTNLSRFAQPVERDLSKVEGMTPVEMLGYVEFPPIERHRFGRHWHLTVFSG